MALQRRRWKVTIFLFVCACFCFSFVVFLLLCCFPSWGMTLQRRCWKVTVFLFVCVCVFYCFGVFLFCFCWCFCSSWGVALHYKKNENNNNNTNKNIPGLLTLPSLSTPGLDLSTRSSLLAESRCSWSDQEIKIPFGRNDVFWHLIWLCETFIVTLNLVGSYDISSE